MKTMKAVTVYGPRDARMEDVPKPQANDDMIEQGFVKEYPACIAEIIVCHGLSG